MYSLIELPEVKFVQILALLFIGVPIIEMVLLIKIGGMIGAIPTVALVFLTAAIGVTLLRIQGPATFLRAQQRMQTGQLPAKEMIEGIFLAVGGALLLTPGFFTDAVGFCCLFPGIRDVIIMAALKNIKFSSFQSSHFSNHRSCSGDDSGEIIDGEFSRHDQSSVTRKK